MANLEEKYHSYQKARNFIHASPIEQNMPNYNAGEKFKCINHTKKKIIPFKQILKMIDEDKKDEYKNLHELKKTKNDSFMVGGIKKSKKKKKSIPRKKKKYKDDEIKLMIKNIQDDYKPSVKNVIYENEYSSSDSFEFEYVDRSEDHIKMTYKMLLALQNGKDIKKYKNYIIEDIKNINNFFEKCKDIEDK